MPTAEGSASDLSALANHAEKLFKELIEQAAVPTLPTARREESLATLQRLDVITEAEAKTIATSLAKGGSSAIEAARNRTSSPVTRALLNFTLMAGEKRQQSANQASGAKLSLSDEEWADVGDAIIIGAGAGAGVGAAVGAAGTAGFGTVHSAFIGAFIGGVIGGGVKVFTAGSRP